MVVINTQVIGENEEISDNWVFMRDLAKLTDLLNWPAHDLVNPNKQCRQGVLFVLEHFLMHCGTNHRQISLGVQTEFRESKPRDLFKESL